jgi:hypothetical protein
MFEDCFVTVGYIAADSAASRGGEQFAQVRKRTDPKRIADIVRSQASVVECNLLARVDPILRIDPRCPKQLVDVREALIRAQPTRLTCPIREN